MKVKKANTMVGLILSTFSYLEGRLFRKLFTVFVKPHLEYGQVIWTLYLKKYVTILENMTKIVAGLHHLCYSERLRKLNLPSLVYRRTQGDMIELFKTSTPTIIVRYQKMSDLKSNLTKINICFKTPPVEFSKQLLQ